MGDQSILFSHKIFICSLKIDKFGFTLFNNYDSRFTLARNGLHSKPKKFCGWTYVFHSCINKESLFDT